MQNLRKYGKIRRVMEIGEFAESLMKGFMDLGVRKGDKLYVSSDMTHLTLEASRACGLKRREDLDRFYEVLTDSMKELVGEEGTLLYPVFTWSFCKGTPFHAKTTQGEVGAWGNWVLNNRPDFRRTKNPMYSFMVWGKDAEELLNMDNRTAWGKDSPFGWLREHHGRNLIIDVSLSGSFTFLHHVEETIRVPHRYFKDFRGEYEDAEGNIKERVYTLYVRDLDIESRQVTPDDCLVEAGAAKKAQFGKANLQLVELADAYPLIEENLRQENGSNWYDFYGYRLNWDAGQTHPDETSGDFTA